MLEKANTVSNSQTQSWSKEIQNLKGIPLKFESNQQIEPQQAIATAIQILQDGDFQQQWAVAKILPQLGTGAIAPLIGLIENPSASLQTRWFAARTLGQFDAPAAVMALVKLLQTTEEEDLRAIAAGSLAQIGDAAVSSIERLLAESDARIHLSLVQALAYIRSSATIEPLLKLVDHSDAQIRACAVEALGSFRDGRIVSALIQALQDPAAIVRKEAVMALSGWSQQPDLVDRLQPLLYDHSLPVCEKAAIALGKIATPTAAEALGELLLTPTTPPPLQLCAVRSLGWIESARAIDYLGQALSTSSIEIRLEIVRSLGRISLPSLQSQATEILTAIDLTPPHSSIELKKTLATSLGQLSIAAAIPTLTRLSQDESAMVRLHATAALKKITAVCTPIKYNYKLGQQP